jgi:methylenetetrahydrofolate dehydrogenase (NADP+)/methenyltetrahydrofolate cyclohydrolase
MSAKILNGKAISEQIMHNLKAKIAIMKQQKQQIPGLAVILVSSDKASAIYVNKKKEACKQAGIISEEYNLPDTIPEIELAQLIKKLNSRGDIHGILVQLPLPNHINTDKIMELIDPKKDVDGFHPYNVGKLLQRKPLLRPCTPKGIMKLLAHTKENLKGKKALIIGASSIVGRPMALELLIAGCTTTIAHRFTKNLDAEISMADILIVAIGKPNIINSASIKPGAIVIDVGINRTESGKIVGDVLFNSAKEKASWITPVPGGVGPMTVVSLIENTIQAAEQHQANTL